MNVEKLQEVLEKVVEVYRDRIEAHDQLDLEQDEIYHFEKGKLTAYSDTLCFIEKNLKGGK